MVDVLFEEFLTIPIAEFNDAAWCLGPSNMAGWPEAKPGLLYANPPCPNIIRGTWHPGYGAGVIIDILFLAPMFWEEGMFVAENYCIYLL